MDVNAAFYKWHMVAGWHGNGILADDNLRKMDKHSGEATLSKLFCFPFKKGSTLKE